MDSQFATDGIAAFSLDGSDYRRALPLTPAKIGDLAGLTFAASGPASLAVACYPDTWLGPSNAPAAISMLFAMSPVPVTRNILLFSPATANLAWELVERGACKLGDLSGSAGWGRCIFDEGDFELSRSRPGALLADSFAYRGELTQRNASNYAMRDWSRLGDEIGDYLHGAGNGQHRLSDSMLLMSFGLEGELPLDRDHVLPLNSFDLSVEGDNPRRFSDYRYKEEQTRRIRDVYEILRSYCDSNSIRPYIHRTGFAANMEEMERINEMTGVKSAMEAYYEGAPVNYILAGIRR